MTNSLIRFARFRSAVLQRTAAMVLLLLGIALTIPPASAAPFTVSIAGTGTNVHLKATTVPASRLIWYKGDRLNAITNVVLMEGTAMFQHDLVLTSGVSAAFYRAANSTTNLAPVPLALGASHSLAILTNGQIACWGKNTKGQFGNDAPARQVPYYWAACWNLTAETNGSTGPLPQSADTDWVSVAAGDDHCLAVKANGTMWAWGDGTYGQLGDSNYFGGGWISFALQIGTNRLWRSVFASQNSSFAIANDGTLWAWGLNKATWDAKGSVLGLGDAYTNVTSVLVPSQVGTGSNWVKVVAWPGVFGAGIQSDGSLWAWGNTTLPSYVRAGYATTNFNTPLTTSPAATGIPGPWVDLALGGPYGAGAGIVALRADGTLWAHPPINANDVGWWAMYMDLVRSQYSDPNSMYNVLVGAGMSPAGALAYTLSVLGPYRMLTPEVLAALDYPAMLKANADANLLQPYSSRGGWVMVDNGIALNQDGTIWTVGESSSAARSPGSPRDGDWQRVNADTDWRYVRSGSGFAGIKADGRIWTWGAGGSSAYLLGNGCVSSATDLTKIPGTNKWKSAKQDNTHVVALDIQSNLWVWGGNTSGELGLGDNEPRLTPTPLPLAGPWLDYALVGNGTVAIRQNGELWVWGNYNATGTNRVTPLRLNPERSWRSVFASANQGYDQVYVLAQDHTLWAFGRNYTTGNLGLGIATNTVIAAPQPLPGSNWCFVSPSSIAYHTLAVRTDGTLWAWGRNFGDLGLPYVANQILTTPVQVPGSNWVSVAAGCGEGFGIRSDGTLWAWGGGPPTVTANDLLYPIGIKFQSTLGIPSLNSPINTVYYSCLYDPGNNPPKVYLATTNNVSTPVQVDADTTWKIVSSASQGSNPTKLGLKQDGSLWLWGLSPFASVTNSAVYLTPPTHPYPNVPYPVNVSMLPVPQRVGTNLWASVDLPGTAAVTTAGDLYLWGQNQNGQLLLPPAWLPQPVLSNVVCRLPLVIP